MTRYAEAFFPWKTKKTKASRSAYLIVIYRVQVLCCKTAHGVSVTKRETTANNTQSSTSSGSSSMCAYKTGFSIAQTTPQSSSYIFRHWNKKKGECHKHTHHHPGFDPRTPRSERQQPTCSPSQVLNLTIYQIDTYLYERIDVWGKLSKRRKQHPPRGDDASTV